MILIKYRITKKYTHNLYKVNTIIIMQRKILSQLPNPPQSPSHNQLKQTLTKIITKLDQNTKQPKYYQYSQSLKQISWSLGKCAPYWPAQIEQLVQKLLNQLSSFEAQLLADIGNRGKGSVWICGSSSKSSRNDVLELMYKKVLGYQCLFNVVTVYQDKKYKEDMVYQVVELVNKNMGMNNSPSRSQKSFSQQQNTINTIPNPIPINPMIPTKQPQLQSQSQSPQPCQTCQLLKSISVNPNTYITKKLLNQLPDVQWIAGILHQQGKYVEKSIDKAIKCYQIARKKRNPEGFYRLGLLNEKGVYGQGLEYIRLWEEAAAMGHLQAMTDLGFLYENGLEENGRWLIQPNPEKTLQYYSSGVQKNFPRALNNLASFYFNNPKYRNEQKCLQYFQRASQLQYVKSLYNLGIIYLQGQIGSQNKQKARILLKKAAQKGDIQAKQQYIELILTQIDKCTADDLDQINLYCRQIIAEQEDSPYAYYFLGIMYEAGYGVPQEPKTALLYYTKAAKYQCPQAYIKLADCFKNGFGVEQNSKDAINYYQKATKSLPEAYVYIGQMYQRGFPDLKQNYQQAFNYYSSACNNDVSQGYSHIANLYKHGKHVKKDQGKAEQYFSKARNSIKKGFSRLSVSNQLISSSYYRSKK